MIILALSNLTARYHNVIFIGPSNGLYTVKYKSIDYVLI